MDWEPFFNNFRKPDFITGYEIQNRLGGGAFGLVPASSYDAATGLVNATGPARLGDTILLATTGDQRWFEGVGPGGLVPIDSDGDGVLDSGPHLREQGVRVGTSEAGTG